MLNSSIPPEADPDRDDLPDNMDDVKPTMDYEGALDRAEIVLERHREGREVTDGLASNTIIELRRIVRVSSGRPTETSDALKLITRAYLTKLIEAVQAAPRPREADERLSDALDNLYAEIEWLNRASSGRAPVDLGPPVPSDVGSAATPSHLRERKPWPCDVCWDRLCNTCQERAASGEL